MPGSGWSRVTDGSCVSARAWMRRRSARCWSQTYQDSNRPRGTLYLYRTRKFCPHTPHTARPCRSAEPSRGGDPCAVGLPIPEVLKLRYEDPRNSLMENWRVQGRKSLSGPADEPQYTPLKHLDALFKNWRVSAITADAVRKYARERKDAGAAIGTINRSLSALKRMFHIAVADGKLAVIPHIEMLPEAPARKGFLEVEQFHRLCEFLSKHLRPVLTMGYYTGMRLGEVRNLKWENVDLVEKSIRLYDDETKTGEPRIVARLVSCRRCSKPSGSNRSGTTFSEMALHLVASEKHGKLLV